MRISTKDYDANIILKFLRENLDLTQKDLAKEQGLAKSSIEKYDVGLVNFPYILILNIAKEHNLNIWIKSKKGNDICINALDYEPNTLFRYIRKINNYSQKKLADATKIGKSSIEKYEAGTVKYSFETLIKVCNTCGLVIVIEDKK